MNEQKTPSRLLEKKAGRTLGFVIYGSPEQLSGGYFYDRALAAALKHQGFHVQWISLEPGAPSSKVERALDGHWDFLLYDELCHEVLVPSSLRLPHGPRHIGLVHHFRYQEDWGASKRIAIQKQEKAFCKKMEAFVVNSKHTARQVTDLLQEDHLSERDQAINSGTETPLFLAYPSGNLWPRGKTLPPKKFGSLRLFFLGNLIPRKGLHRLVEALAILSEEHPGTWECRLGGAPSDSFYVQGLKKQINDAGLQKYVRFLGKLDEEALEETWSWCNLFCLPSQMEGFGMVFLEAASRGIPVIGPRTGGVPEVVEQGFNGYLLEENTPREIADILLRVINDQSLWKRLSRGSITKAASFGSWEESFGGLGDFFQDPPKYSNIRLD